MTGRVARARQRGPVVPEVDLSSDWTPDDDAWLQRTSLGVWTIENRGHEMSDLHWEWCELAQTQQRLAVIAPRDHAKSETFTIDQVAWRSVHTTGFWSFVFSATLDQGMALLERIVAAIEASDPDLVERASKNNKTELVLANRARVTVAGVGRSVRGKHPDLIVLDDVLEEDRCRTRYQREKTKRWFNNTVANMVHPAESRDVRLTRRRRERHQFGPTIIHLVGTPFHDEDLMMSLRKNRSYHFRRYAGEFYPHELARPGRSLAVEIRGAADGLAAE